MRKDTNPPGGAPRAVPQETSERTDGLAPQCMRASEERSHVAFARAQKSAFGQMSEQNRQELATKTDLLVMENRLQAETAALRTDMLEMEKRLQAEMAEMKAGLQAEMAAHKNTTQTALLELKSELKSDMGKLRSDMRSDMASLKHDILRWTLSFVIGMSGFLAGVMYFFLRTMR